MTDSTETDFLLKDNEATAYYHTAYMRELDGIMERGMKYAKECGCDWSNGEYCRHGQSS